MKKRVVKVAGGVIVVGVLAGGVAVGAIAWSIHQAVEENCRVAQQAHPHPGDNVAALIDFVNSTSHSPEDRSHVGVWTLGRLRDPRALPALECVYTGEPCQHERNLCQYELEKTIKLCGGTPEQLGWERQ